LPYPVTWKTVWALTGAELPDEALKRMAGRFAVGTYQSVSANHDQRLAVGNAAGPADACEPWFAAWIATRARAGSSGETDSGTATGVGDIAKARAPVLRRT